MRIVYYGEIFEIVKEHAIQKSVFQGCNFWAWGGFAQPQHLFWQKGDDYTIAFILSTLSIKYIRLFF